MRVVIADDHGIVRDGLKLILSRVLDYSVIGEAEDGFQAIRLCGKLKPEILIVDLNMPGLDGFQTVLGVRRQSPATRILILTGVNSSKCVERAMSLGVSGYVLKDAVGSDLERALRTVRNGGIYISPGAVALVDKRILEKVDCNEHITEREKQILKLLAEGHTNQEVADLLSISVKTVERHRENLTRKLNVRNPVGLAAVAIREGLIGHEWLGEGLGLPS